jgi:KDO2-lipid IV(A) lauroyltransferase
MSLGKPLEKKSIRLKYKLEYSVLLFVRFLANVLPVSVSEWIGRRLGDIAWYFFPYRFQVMMYNMDIVFPEKSHEYKLHLAHHSYRFFGEMAVQFFSQNKKKNKKRILSAEIQGREFLDKALNKGKGVILTALHSGNWEYVASWLNMSGIITSGIYKPMKNPLSDEFFLSLRLNMGDAMHMISTRQGMKAYEKALKQNHVLAVAVDQNAHEKGVKVPFFNRITSIAKGTAVLKFRTDAEILGMVPLYQHGKFYIHFFPVNDEPISVLNDETIGQTMKSVMKSFEPWIVRYPSQWMWFHKLWGSPDKTYKRTLYQILRY